MAELGELAADVGEGGREVFVTALLAGAEILAGPLVFGFDVLLLIAEGPSTSFRCPSDVLFVTDTFLFQMSESMGKIILGEVFFRGDVGRCVFISAYRRTTFRLDGRVKAERRRRYVGRWRRAGGADSAAPPDNRLWQLFGRPDSVASAEGHQT